MKPHKSNLICALAGAVAFALAPAVCGQDKIFLRVEGVPGESASSSHAGEIDATGFSFGVSTTIDSSTGQPGGTAFADLSVTKFVDKASPLLMLHCAQGATLPKVTLFVQSTSSSPLDYYKVTLSNVKVTGLSTSGQSDGRPTETVTFYYDRIQIDYIPRKADGSAGTPVSSCWDVRQQRTCS